MLIGHSDIEKKENYTTTFCPTLNFVASTSGPNSTIVPENLVRILDLIEETKEWKWMGILMPKSDR